MVAVNFAQIMDLSGQVYADALPQNHFSGVTGMLDFVMGASMSSGGKSIIVIPARSLDGQTSRIRLNSSEGSIVIPNGCVSSVISEFGMINLFKKLPCRTDTTIEGGTVVLKCRFETTS